MKRRTIEVEIDGKIYPTVIDKHGVQIFPQNSLCRYLVDSKQIDLDKLALDYEKRRFSLNDYMQFYRDIGYSVCGYLGIFGREIRKIKNPLWDK